MDFLCEDGIWLSALLTKVANVAGIAETKTVVANSDGKGVSSDLTADLGGGDLDTLHHGSVGNGTSGGKEGGSSVGKAGVGKTSIGEDLGISISIGRPLANVVSVTVGKAITISGRDNSRSSNMGYWQNGWVVDEGGGGSQDLGGAGKDGRVSLSVGRPLANVVSITVGKAITISTRDNSRGSNMGYREHGRVVDEGGGGSQDLGGASEDGRVSLSLPLANVVSSIAETKTVVANSEGESVSSDLRLDLSRGLLHTLDNRDMGHSTGSSKAQGGGVGKAEPSVGEACTVQQLGVSLRGSQGNSGQRGKES